MSDPQNEFTSSPAHYRAENTIISGTWSTSHKTEELWAIKTLQCQTNRWKKMAFTLRLTYNSSKNPEVWDLFGNDPQN